MPEPITDERLAQIRDLLVELHLGHIADELLGEVARLRALLEGATEEWAVVYPDGSHCRVSSSTQTLQLAVAARRWGHADAYAGHRLLPEWRRLELDRG